LSCPVISSLQNILQDDTMQVIATARVQLAIAGTAAAAAAALSAACVTAHNKWMQ
jgi:hypothetical protein